MAESFENLDDILHDWANIRYQTSFWGIKQVREAERKRKSRFFLETYSKKYSSSLSRQSSESKPNTKLVLK